MRGDGGKGRGRTGTGGGREGRRAGGREGEIATNAIATVKGLMCIETHLAIHCGNGVRSRGGGLKRDETEATRATRVLVHHHLGLSKAHSRHTTTDVKQARSQTPLYMRISAGNLTTCLSTALVLVRLLYVLHLHFCVTAAKLE